MSIKWHMAGLNPEEFAREAHEDQFRKHTGEPYINHPIRVAEMVMALPDATDDMVAAAYLHDVVEDTYVGDEDIIREFGKKISFLVWELTNTSKQNLLLNRFGRKEMDRRRLAKVSDEAKIIKMCDRIDNLRDLTQEPGPDGLKFLWLYTNESERLLEVIGDAHAELTKELEEVIQQAREVL